MGWGGRGLLGGGGSGLTAEVDGEQVSDLPFTTQIGPSDVGATGLYKDGVRHDAYDLSDATAADVGAVDVGLLTPAPGGIVLYGPSGLPMDSAGNEISGSDPGPAITDAIAAHALLTDVHNIPGQLAAYRPRAELIPATDITGLGALAPPRLDDIRTSHTFVNKSTGTIDKQSVALLTIPGGIVGDGDEAHYAASGDALNNTSSAVTFRWRLWIQNALVADTTAISWATSAQRIPWKVVVEMWARGDGSASIDAFLPIGAGTTAATWGATSASRTALFCSVLSVDLTTDTPIELTVDIGNSTVQAEVVRMKARLNHVETGE